MIPTIIIITTTTTTTIIIIIIIIIIITIIIIIIIIKCDLKVNLISHFQVDFYLCQIKSLCSAYKFIFREILFFFT